MSLLLAFFKGKCPQCREGNVFTHKGTNLKNFREMHSHCPSCEVKFESEPGFFWGAMYFSYVYSVASFIIIGFFFFTLSEDVNLGYYIGTVIAFTLLTSTISFRMSRLLMMYIAAPYRKYKGNYTANR
jgi:uncharacterized protein (DUF983 family)